MSAPPRAHRASGSTRGRITGSLIPRGRGTSRDSASDQSRGARGRPVPKTTNAKADGSVQGQHSGKLNKTGIQHGSSQQHSRGRTFTPRGASQSLRGHGFSPALASPVISRPSSPENASPQKDFMNAMMVKFQALKQRRDAERATAIRDGFLADPDQKTSLDKAITPVGTCTEMCPEFERVERIVQNMVDRTEKVRNNGAGRAVPSEVRMIKRFRRSAAGYEEQLPSDIRTPATLKSTLDYLFDYVVGGKERLATVHKFVWDRTRSIRNDFSIQQVTKDEDVKLAVECFERIARFHILSLHQLSKPENLVGENFDAHQEREQLNNTLLSLMYYYDDNRHRQRFKHEEEFRAYCIIFELQSQHPDLEDRMQSWPQSLLNDKRVQTAFKLYSAAGNNIYDQGPLRPSVPYWIAQGDPGSFWALLKSKAVSYLMACVGEIYFGQIRFVALQNLLKSNNRGPPTQLARIQEWTLEALTQVLAFDHDEEALDFCEMYGINFNTQTDGTQYLDFTNQSLTLDKSLTSNKQTFSESLVESKRFGRTLPAVINGISVAQAIRQGLVETSPDLGSNDDTMDEDNDEEMFFADKQEDRSQIVAASSSLAELNPMAVPFTPGDSTVSMSHGSSVKFGKPSVVQPSAMTTSPLSESKILNQPLASSGSSYLAVTDGLASAAPSTKLSVFSGVNWGSTPRATPSSLVSQAADASSTAPIPHLVFGQPSTTLSQSGQTSSGPSKFGHPFGAPTLSGQTSLTPASSQQQASNPSMFGRASFPALQVEQREQKSVEKAGDFPIFEPLSHPIPPPEHSRSPRSPTRTTALNDETNTKLAESEYHAQAEGIATKQPSSPRVKSRGFLEEFSQPLFSTNTITSTHVPLSGAESLFGNFSETAPLELGMNHGGRTASTVPNPPASLFPESRPIPNTESAALVSQKSLPAASTTEGRSAIVNTTNSCEPKDDHRVNEVYSVTPLNKPSTSQQNIKTTHSHSPRYRPYPRSGPDHKPLNSSPLVQQLPITGDSSKPSTPPLPQSAKPVPTSANHQEAVNAVAWLAMLQPDGMMQHYVEYALPTILKDVMTGFESEKEDVAANSARRHVLAKKYFSSWKTLAWRSKLNRRAKVRRQIFAQSIRRENQRQTRADAELEEILAAKKEKELIQTEQVSQRLVHPTPCSPVNPAGEGGQTSSRKRKSIHIDQTKNITVCTDQPPKIHKSHKRSRTLRSTDESSVATSAIPAAKADEHSTPRFGSFLFAEKSSFSGSSGSQLRRPSLSMQVDTTCTDYFRLKALEIDPDTPLIPETKSSLERKRQRQAEQMAQSSRLRASSISSSSGSAKPAEWSDRVKFASTIRSSPFSAPTNLFDRLDKTSAPKSLPDLGTKPKPTSALARSTANSPTFNADDEEDELLCRVREVKAVMTDQTNWFKTQAVEMEKEVEVQAELRRSASSRDSASQMSPSAKSGLATANGYQYAPNLVATGRILSRTEQRIRRTGGHGLATKPLGGGDYLAVAMSRSTKDRLAREAPQGDATLIFTIDNKKRERQDNGKAVARDTNHVTLDPDEVKEGLLESRGREAEVDFEHDSFSRHRANAGSRYQREESGRDPFYVYAEPEAQCDDEDYEVEADDEGSLEDGYDAIVDEPYAQTPHIYPQYHHQQYEDDTEELYEDDEEVEEDAEEEEEEDGEECYRSAQPAGFPQKNDWVRRHPSATPETDQERHSHSLTPGIGVEMSRVTSGTGASAEDALVLDSD